MSEFDYDFDHDPADAPKGEFGFDYDSNDVLYHYGDGFATGSDGKQYMEVGGGHVVDLETNQVHYAPTGSSAGDTAAPYGLWPYIGVFCALVCLVYTGMIFKTDAKYIFHALVTGFGAYYSFKKCK